jgi:tryptophan synthase alpha chain
MAINFIDRFANLPKKGALSIFFTAGYPRLNDTLPILKLLQHGAGVDMVEIGFPFSDPISDGPTIQESNRIAIDNGMRLELLFDQLRAVRSEGITIPLLLMGYLNPVEQFGFERFAAAVSSCGIDGLIIPDLPFEQYKNRYSEIYKRNNLRPVFLVTPRTTEARVAAFLEERPAFLYLLSSDGVTGGALEVSSEREEFFKRIADTVGDTPLFVGFGVRDQKTFRSVTKYTTGAIVGSHFLKALKDLAAGAGTRDDVSDLEIAGSDGAVRLAELVRGLR